MGNGAADRVIVARIAEAARRYAATGQISGRERAQAVAALRSASGERPDLLAEHAGLCLGWALAVPGPQAAVRRLEAELCIEAGADPDLIPAWRQTGYFRALASGSGQCPR